MLHHNDLHVARIEKKHNCLQVCDVKLLFFELTRNIMYIIQAVLRTMLRALSVVSSREAAKHPSSVDPPSHIPANAAMLLEK